MKAVREPILHPRYFFGTLILLPVLYVLSVGPVVYFDIKLNGMPAMDAPPISYCEPMQIFREGSFLSKPVGAYLDWWERLAEKQSLRADEKQR